MDNSIPDEEQTIKLYQKMYGRMIAYATSVLRDRNLAEEVAQDTFCIFCAKAGTTLQHENPQGWLMRTLQNVIRNMQRHRSTKPSTAPMLTATHCMNLRTGKISPRRRRSRPPQSGPGVPAALIAALAACLLCGMAVAQAAGVDVFDAIAQWTDETFLFVSVAHGDTADSAADQEDADQYQSLLQSIGMDSLFPTWHPDDFYPGELQITEWNDSVSAHINFFGEDRTYAVTVVYFTQPTDNTGTFEKDDTPVEEYDHNGQTFYILSNMDSLTATTFDGEFMTMICGSLTREKIRAIIDSIPGPQSA